ncbi:GNAT family N-acetyltransferase [bacterium]|nr:MAG: GNAT family N-acetyltransferase [bacterium]
MKTVKLKLRKVIKSDMPYFLRWWKDREIIGLTSGVYEKSNKILGEYFLKMLKNCENWYFVIVLNKKIIGHISLVKGKNGWYETQIIIGEKNYWGKGYGTKAIQLLIKKAKNLGISKICLEVRPDNLRAINAYENSRFVKIKIKKYSKNKFLPETLLMKLKI